MSPSDYINEFLSEGILAGISDELKEKGVSICINAETAEKRISERKSEILAAVKSRFEKNFSFPSESECKKNMESYYDCIGWEIKNGGVLSFPNNETFFRHNPIIKSISGITFLFDINEHHQNRVENAYVFVLYDGWRKHWLYKIKRFLKED